MRTEKLIPRDSHKSFYGKAVIFFDDDNCIAILKSYGTPVAAIKHPTGETIRLWGGWSATTMRHINSFTMAFAGRKYKKSEWENIPMDWEVKA